jgi:hypothetical protein
LQAHSEIISNRIENPPELNPSRAQILLSICQERS